MGEAGDVRPVAEPIELDACEETSAPLVLLAALFVLLHLGFRGLAVLLILVPWLGARRRIAHLRVTEQGLWVGGRLRVRLEDRRDAFVRTEPGREHEAMLVITDASGHSHVFRTADVASAETLASELALPGVRAAGGGEGASWSWAAVAAAVALVALLRGAVPVAMLVVGGAALMVVQALGAMRILAGVDGVEIRSLGMGRRFIAYRDVQVVADDTVSLASGEMLRLKYALMGGFNWRWHAHERVLARVREGAEQARVRARVSQGAEAATALEVAAVLARAEQASYREASVTDDVLWRVVEAADVAPTARVRAAEALEQRNGPVARVRIAEIAISLADSDARDALMRVAEDEPAPPSDAVLFDLGRD